MYREYLLQVLSILFRFSEKGSEKGSPGAPGELKGPILLAVP